MPLSVIQRCYIVIGQNIYKNQTRKLKATLNRRFKLFRRQSIYNIYWQLVPQSGAATLNAQLPYELSQNTGT